MVLDCEQFLHLVLIEANHHVIADADDWDTHLAGHFDHLLTLLGVCRNVYLGKLHIVLIHKILGGMTEMAGGCGVNGNVCIHT